MLHPVALLRQQSSSFKPRHLLAYSLGDPFFPLVCGGEDGEGEAASPSSYNWSKPKPVLGESMPGGILGR